MNALDNRFVNAVRDFVKHEPPYVPKVIGYVFYTDAILFSAVVGALTYVLSQKLYQVLKERNGGHAHFPFEKVGTKQQSLKHPEEAYKLFNQAYDLYCLFWGLNMNMIDVSDVKWIENKSTDVAAFSEHLDSAEKTAERSAESDVPAGTFGKMKTFVRKAVDCCIE